MYDCRVLRQIQLQDLCCVCNLAMEIPPLLGTLLKVPGGSGRIACYKDFAAVQDIQLVHNVLTGPLP